MFSLIMALISIVLVGILAVASIYYGGTSYSQAAAKAKAATIVNQGQQLLGAAQSFEATNGRWPNDITELVSSGFLNQVPIVQADPLPTNEFYQVPTAYADTTGTWSQPAPGVPAYVFVGGIEQPVCQSVNFQVRKDNGILSKAYPALITQCFGLGAPFGAVVSAADTTAFTSALPAGTVSLSGLPAVVLPPGVPDLGYSVGPTVIGAPSTGVPPATGPSNGNTGALSNFVIPSKKVGDAPFILTPPSSASTGVITYASSDSSIATVSGNLVTIVGSGTATITASQAASGTFPAAVISAPLSITALISQFTLTGSGNAGNASVLRCWDSTPFYTSCTEIGNGQFPYGDASITINNTGNVTLTILDATIPATRGWGPMTANSPTTIGPGAEFSPTDCPTTPIASIKNYFKPEAYAAVPYYAARASSFANSGLGPYYLAAGASCNIFIRSVGVEGRQGSVIPDGAGSVVHTTLTVTVDGLPPKSIDISTTLGGPVI